MLFLGICTIVVVRCVIIHYDLNAIQIFNHLIHGLLEDFWGTFHSKG